ncbi:MAG: hypothetical protein KF803_05565 [Cyclobacteriaceae bacterium]|nr:hypothetical protein [Cyclobacteriaceae bacterium]
MKTIYLSFILLLCFACSQPTATDNTSDEPETEIDSPTQDDISEDESEQAEPSSSDGPVVYITHDGDKYHTADCRYSKTAHAVKLNQAKADGKTVCGVCKPNSKTGEKQVRCSGKTAEGKRCSRTTTDASGKCFQHRE